MKQTSHQAFSLFMRGDSPSVYVSFWDESLQKYMSARSTGTASKKEARNIAQAWLGKYNGPPPREGKNKGITKDQLIAYMSRFLRENTGSEDIQSLSVDELISKISLILTGTDINTDNPIFVEYCLNFWDWEKSLYIKDKLESGQSIGKTYCSNNKRFIEIYAVPFFGEQRIRGVTTGLLEKFKAELPRKNNNKGLAPRSINAILGCIGTALGEAKRLGIVQENVATSMRKLSLNGTRRGVLTHEEVKRVLMAEWADERAKVASQLSACHGLRAGEIGALRIQDLDFSKNIIHVRGSWERQQRVIKTTKNGHDRVVYSNEQVMACLKALYVQNPHNNDYIFWNIDKDDEPMNLDNFRDHLEKVLVSIGINKAEQRERKITFHSWRHFANSSIRGEIADAILQQAMGHSSVAMTDRYHHVTDEQNEMYRKSVETHILPFVFS